MDRRRFLATVALVGVTGGCSESTANQSPTAPRYDETPTPSQEPPTETKTETPGPEGESPAKRARVSELELDGAQSGALYDMVRTGDGVVCSGHLDGNPALVALDSDLDVQWSRIYSDWEVEVTALAIDDMPSIGRASDGGYTVGVVPANVEKTAIVFKTDPHGQIEWKHSFEVYSSAIHARLIDLGDGTYAYAWTDRAVDIASVTVVGYDPSADDTLWEREYDDYWLDRMTSTADGGCFLSGGGLRTGLWMTEIESDGTEAWQYDADDYTFTGGRQIENRFVLWNTNRIRVLDGDGEPEWTREYEILDTYVSTVVPTENDALLCLSSAKQGAWLTKLTATGDVKWQIRYGIVRRDDVRLGAIQPVDGRYVITGGFDERDTTEDGWVAVVEE